MAEPFPRLYFDCPPDQPTVNDKRAWMAIELAMKRVNREVETAMRRGDRARVLWLWETDREIVDTEFQNYLREHEDADASQALQDAPGDPRSGNSSGS